MTIKYDVTANPLKAHTYYPRTIAGSRIPLQRLIDDIVDETTLTETDTRAVVNALKRRVVAYLLDGQMPDLEGLVCFSSSLSEELSSANSSVSTNVTLRVRARPSAELQKLVRNQAHLERVYTRQRLPVLTALYDVQSQQEEVYTPGNIARLHGDDLKFNPQAEDEGVFFCAVEDNLATRVTTYAQTGVREVIFLVPANLQNAQYIELRTRFGTETLRVGRMRTTVDSALSPATV